jgi:hypothetical protein
MKVCMPVTGSACDFKNVGTAVTSILPEFSVPEFSERCDYFGNHAAEISLVLDCQSEKFETVMFRLAAVIDQMGQTLPDTVVSTD